MSLEQIAAILGIVTAIYTIWKDWPEIKRRLPRLSSARTSPPPRYGVYSYSYLPPRDTPGVVIARHLILSMGLFGFIGFFMGLSHPQMSSNMAAFMGVMLGIMGLIYVGVMGFIFGGIVGLFLRQTHETIASAIKGAFLTGTAGSLGCGVLAKVVAIPPPPGQSMEAAILSIVLFGAVLGAATGVFFGAVAKIL